MERTFVWRDQTYYVADKFGLAPLMRFAHIAKQGVDSDDMEGLAAMYDLLGQCFTEKSYCSACKSIDLERLTVDEPKDGQVDGRCCPDRRVVESEFDRWMDHATAVRADQDEILEVVKLATQALTARPTERSSPSRPGPSTTSTSTAAAPSRSPEQVQRDLERSGRPDLALVVAQAQEARTA